MNNWFAAAAAGVLAVFGFAGDRAPTTTHSFNGGTSTHKVERVASSTKPTLDISCVAAAVAAREASLDNAASGYTSGINAAYTARASALASAYALSGNDVIKTAVKAAWKQFTTATQGTKRAWQKSRENAWQTFRTAIKSCGPTASSLADTANAGSELSGQ
jgi:hypothetical protein